MNIKDFIKTAMIIIVAFCIFDINISAEENYDFGQIDIEKALPDNAENELEQLGVSTDNGGSNLDLGNVFSRIWDMICESIPKPVSMLISVVGVVLLCTVIQSMHQGESELSETFNTIGVLACSGIICTSFGTIISSSSTAIEGLGAFLSVYIPAFAGIMAANGQTATAAAYNGIITVAVQIFSQIFTFVIFPLVNCIMGISIAGAVNPDLKINNIAEMVRKIINWGLAFIMTVFAGILSVQSFVGAAADSVSMKAAKFTVSGTVPIVGGAVSDALLTVKGSIGVIKASTGGYGIIASAAVMLPALITLFLFRIIFTISASVSDTFGISRITAVLKSGENILSIIIAMMVCFWAVAIVSTALMLVIGGGGI